MCRLHNCTRGLALRALMCNNRQYVVVRHSVVPHLCRRERTAALVTYISSNVFSDCRSLRQMVSIQMAVVLHLSSCCIHERHLCYFLWLIVVYLLPLPSQHSCFVTQFRFSMPPIAQCVACAYSVKTVFELCMKCGEFLTPAKFHGKLLIFGIRSDHE